MLQLFFLEGHDHLGMKERYQAVPMPDDERGLSGMFLKLRITHHRDTAF